MDNYRRYRWFYTSRGTLVVGGKNAEQNDGLLRDILKMKKVFYVMHTAHPGSPFSIILEDQAKITKKELEECAIFTACFSRAWKERKKKTLVDVFSSSQLSKEGDMKTGTWRVKGKIERQEAELKLALIKQEKVLRAVPLSVAPKKERLMVICPGTIDKDEMSAKWEVMLGSEVSQEELMGALPAGGVKECE